MKRRKFLNVSTIPHRRVIDLPSWVGPVFLFLAMLAATLFLPLPW